MTIYADENKNLIFFSWIRNPAYDPVAEQQKMFDWMELKKAGLTGKYQGKRSPNPPDRIPASFAAQNPIVLEYPYTVEDVISAWQRAEENVRQFPPYSQRKQDWFRDPMVFYTGLKKFRDATLGKRLIEVSFVPAHSGVALLLPCKASGVWWGVDSVKLPADAPDEEYAEAVIRLAQMDLKKHPNVKPCKSMLNL